MIKHVMIRTVWGICIPILALIISYVISILLFVPAYFGLLPMKDLQQSLPSISTIVVYALYPLLAMIPLLKHLRNGKNARGNKAGAQDGSGTQKFGLRKLLEILIPVVLGILICRLYFLLVY